MEARARRGCARPRVRTSTALLVLALVALAVPAAAEPREVVADVEITGPLRLDGPVQASASDATFLLTPSADGGLVLEAVAEEGGLRVVTIVREALESPTGAGDHWLPSQEDIEVVPLRDARLVLREPGEHFLAMLAPQGGGRASLGLDAGTRLVTIEEESQMVYLGRPEPTTSWYFTHEIPAGSFRLSCRDTETPAILTEGTLQMALYDAVLEVSTDEGLRVFQLGSREDPRPVVAGRHASYQQTTTYAVAALEIPQVSIAPGVVTTFYSAAPALEVDGRLSMQRAEGVVAFGGTTAWAASETLDFQGALRVVAIRDADEPDVMGQRDERTRFHVEGSADRVLVGGRALFAPPTVQEVAAPAAALLALVVAWLTGAGPKVLAAAAAPLYATATPQSVLANARRRALYQAVLRSPGIHMRELHRATGMRWGSLQYHTALLIATGVLVASRAGRRTVLACDVHHLEPEQIRALHLLRSPRAMGVARMVAQGMATQRTIAEGTGVSFRLVSRYLRLMTDLGLVEQLGEGRPKRYGSTPRLSELLPHAARHDELSAAAMPPAN